ncbi:MAG: hypothetical protein ACE5EX_09075 [Phycisphaerae bacterium]
MRIQELQELVQRRPFEPFIIYMSDGSEYPVSHPDQVILTPRAAYVGIGGGNGALVAEDVVICDLAPMTRLGPAKKPPRKPRKK